jgi:hypothetical protein
LTAETGIQRFMTDIVNEVEVSQQAGKEEYRKS